MKNFVQKGDNITITAAANLTSGTPLIIGHMLAVPEADIASGAIGSVLIEGVVSLPKLSTAVIAVGDLVDWAASAGQVVVAGTAAGDLVGCGIAVSAAGNGSLTVNVKLLPGNATVSS